MLHKTMYWVSIIVLVILSFVHSSAFSVTAVVSGSWGSTVTWGGNPIPSATDDIVIGSGIAVSLTTDITMSGSLTIDGSLDLNGHNLSTGDLSGSGDIDNLLGAGTYTLTVGSNNASTLFSGVIQNTSGIVGLEKVGTGIFTLSGISSFSGTVRISDGRLKFGGAMGNISADVVNNATLQLAQTDAMSGVYFTSDISGTGTLLSTAGTVLLSGNNSYTGPTIINSGKLALCNTNALGSTSNGTQVNGSGYLLIWSGSFVFPPEELELNNSATFRTSLNGATDNAEWTGTVTLTSNDIKIGAYETNDILHISGVIAGPYAITKIGAGVVKLSAANTYTGQTTVSAGILRLANPSALGTVDAGTVVTLGAAIDLFGQNYTAGEALSIEGNGIAGNGVLYSSSIAQSVYAGDIVLADNVTIKAENPIELSGNISNSKNLTKTGAGTLSFVSNTIAVNTLAVNDGTLDAAASAITIAGDFISSATFLPQTSSVRMEGSQAQLLSANSFYDLTIANVVGDVSLQGTISIANSLVMEQGLLFTMAEMVELGLTAIIDETTPSATAPDSYVVGTVTVNREIGNTSGTVDFGGIGAFIAESMTANNLTAVTRITGTPLSVGSAASISRKFNIQPTIDAGLNASLVFRYFDHELQEQDEINLDIYKSEDGGTSWTPVVPVRDPALNELSIASIASFSEWTASDGVSGFLPVELIDFTAQTVPNGVLLQWRTASENGSKLFAIERSTDATEWIKLGAIGAAGTTSLPKNYQYFDTDVFLGKAYYRLCQIDFSGEQHYSPIVSVLQTYRGDYMYYPNPATDMLYVAGFTSGTVLEIFTPDGISGGSFTLDADTPVRVDFLPTGSYLLNFIFNGSTVQYGLLNIE